MKYPYDILSIDESAKQSEIRSAYIKKIQVFTPEKYPEKFQEINEAYNMIKDEVKRAELSVFGVQGFKKNERLADMLVEDHSTRNRIGIDTWLDLMKGCENDCF